MRACPPVCACAGPRGSVVQHIIKTLNSQMSSASQCTFLSKTSITTLIRCLLAHHMQGDSVRLETGAIIHLQLYMENMIRGVFQDALLIASAVSRATVTQKDMAIALQLFSKYTRSRVHHYATASASSVPSALLMTIKAAAAPSPTISSESPPTNGGCELSPGD